MLNEYLFVYSNKDGSFPERLRIIVDGKNSDVPDLDQLTGTVNKKDVETRRDDLKRKFPAPEFDVSTSWANTWRAVQNNYGGMDYEYDPPFSGKGISYSEPETLQSDLGKLLFETAADRKTKAYYLLGTAIFLGFLALLWPESWHFFRNFYGWFLTLIYNPLIASNSLIIPVSFAAGIFTLLRLIYYQRVKVSVYEDGIQMHPGNRYVRWDEVEHLCYARRSLRPYGVPVPTGQSLSLQVSGQSPIKLPHRFNMMAHLISIVRKHVEPVLLDKAVKRLRAEGSVSFGKHITVTQDNLTLNSLKVSIPLSQVDNISIHGGTFQIVYKNQVIFSRLVESIPDATIISRLLAEIRK